MRYQYYVPNMTIGTLTIMSPARHDMLVKKYRSNKESPVGTI